jgi:hypothetical protein
MKTSNSLKKQVANKAPVFIALACAALTGCFSDSGTNPNTNPAYASISGQVQGDVGVATSGSYSAADTGWQATMVTAFAINADGSLGSAQDSVMATANGTFTLQTTARGHKEWILRARRGTAEWMARFEGTLEDGQTETSRPLNLESTLEAAVLLELKKTPEGSEVHSSEVNLAIDAKASASGRGEYRGTDTERNLIVSRLAASIKAASRARKAFLESADSLYTSHRARIDSARVSAEASFEASLHAAARDTVQIRAAEQAFLTAVANAYVKADVERTTYARSAEASYHAFVRASVLLSDSARTATSRNYARVLVIASDTAMRSEFKKAGASSLRQDLVVDASARFRASIDTAGTRARMDSAVVRFRADVKAAFDNTTDTTFTLFGTVAAQLAAALDSTSTSMQLAIASTTSGEAVGSAYATAHISAQAQLESQIRSSTSDSVKAEAAANLLAFVRVGSAGHN